MCTADNHFIVDVVKKLYLGGYDYVPFVYNNTIMCAKVKSRGVQKKKKKNSVYT